MSKTLRKAPRAANARGCAVVLGMSLMAAWPAAQATCQYKQLGVIPATWVDRRLEIDGSVDLAPLKMTIDTGTAWTSVSSAVAARLNLRTAPTVTTEITPAGEKSGTTAKLKELSLGRFQWIEPWVVVGWQGAGAPDVMVGANVLLEHDVELDGHRIVFFAPTGCEDAALGYWADDVPWVPTVAAAPRDQRTVVTVQVNGQPVRALVDSGSPATILDSAAARRLGAEPEDPDAQGGQPAGAGSRVKRVSVARVDAVAIGPEIVRHVRLQVGDLRPGGRGDVPATKPSSEFPEMILGADFVQSHHLLFATSQHRLYFSYLGGEVFSAPPRTAVAAH